MADKISFLFILFGIFQVLYSVDGTAFSQSNSDVDEPVYKFSLADQDVFLDNVVVIRRMPHGRSRRRHPRQAEDNSNMTADASMPGTTVPPAPPAADANVNGDGSQTLPDSPNHANDPVSTNETSNEGPFNTTTPMPTTTADPYKDADIIHDFHDYYKTMAINQHLDEYYTDVSSAIRHKTLSESHRVAVKIKLKFKFLFYGHEVDVATVATGGFIYMSPFVHSWLTATQYVAPLMANFDPSLHAGSHVYYMNDDDKLTVEWSQIKLQDQSQVGNFTFQATLFKNGSIRFAYKDIPVGLDTISDRNHPVKVGLSDAFYKDRYLEQFGVHQRRIYEYHQVRITKSLVRTGSVIIVHPLPTCNLMTDCDSCTQQVNISFDCRWCNKIARCSNGFDWYRQHWDLHGCNSLALNKTADCKHAPPPTKPIVTPIPPLGPQTNKQDKCANGNCDSSSNAPVAVIAVVVIIIVAAVCGLAGWTYYAYTHPTSKSGMWLMEHRPSQLKAKIKFWKSSSGSGDSSSGAAAKYRAESEA